MKKSKCAWFGVNRREFGKVCLLGAAASALPIKASESGLKLPGLGAQEKVLLDGLAKGSSDAAIAEAVRRVAEAATDFSWLSKGDTVYLKPASNSGNKYPATTHPAGVAAMIKLLKEKGAKRVIFSDMAGIALVKLSPDHLRGSTRKLMRNSGLFDAAQAAGAEIYFPEEAGWGAFDEDGPASGSHWKNGIFIPSILKECDHIVLMPRTSKHVLLGNTLGMKCVVGYMRFDSRTEYHRDAATIYEKTAEANTLSNLKNKLRLTLTVATELTTTLGPDSGYVSEPETGLVFASNSLVAHDMFSQAWLNLTRERVPESAKAVYRDPYLSFHNPFNRGTVMLLGGVGEAAKTESYPGMEAKTIFEEPILNRAFHLEGGVPRLTLADVNGKVPVPLMRDLARRVTV